jgi:hypothetical protein
VCRDTVTVAIWWLGMEGGEVGFDFDVILSQVDSDINMFLHGKKVKLLPSLASETIHLRPVLFCFLGVREL